MAWGLRALVAVGVLASPALSLTCPKLCSGHGRCDTGSRQCLCFNGWFGADCSMVHCPFAPAWADIAIAKDHGHNLAECSNKGLCDYETGKCKCYKGFEGQVSTIASSPTLHYFSPYYRHPCSRGGGEIEGQESMKVGGGSIPPGAMTDRNVYMWLSLCEGL